MTYKLRFFLTSIKTILLISSCVFHCEIVQAQMGEIEGELRISDVRPTIEFYDNSPGIHQVEGMIKNIGDEIYLNSFVGPLILGARTDGLNTLTSQLVVKQGPNRGNVGINMLNPSYPLQLANTDTSSLSMGLNQLEIIFLKNGASRSNFSHVSGQSLTIQNSVLPQSTTEHIFRLNARTLTGQIKQFVKITGNGNLGLGGFTGGLPNSSIHLKHRLSNSDPRLDGVTIENDGSNSSYFTFYVLNSNNDLELYNGLSPNPVGRFDAVSGAYSALSDRRVKQDIQPISNALDAVCALNPVAYRFINDPSNDRKHFGLIAQELHTVLPELVEQSQKQDINLVEYSGLLPWLIKAIQELDSKVESQNEEISSYRELIQQQTRLINQLTSNMIAPQ